VSADDWVDRPVEFHGGRADDAPAGDRDQHDGEYGPAGNIGKHAKATVPQRVARPRILSVRALSQAAGVLLFSRQHFPDLDPTHRSPG